MPGPAYAPHSGPSYHLPHPMVPLTLLHGHLRKRVYYQHLRTCPAAEGNNACEHMRMRVQHHHVLLSTRHAARAPRGPFVALGRSTLPTASARQSQRPRLRAPRTEPVHTRPPAAELVTPSLAHAWPAHPLPRQAALCGSGDGFPHGPRAATGSAPPACCPSPPVAVPSRS